MSPQIDRDGDRFEITGEGDVWEFMDFTPHPMSPRMVWQNRRRFGRAWPKAFYRALRGDGPWTENLTEHEVTTVEDYLMKKYEIDPNQEDK